MKIGITGHRPGRLGGYSSDMFDRLTDFAAVYLESKKAEIEIINVGMAMGFDLAVARAAWQLQIPYKAHIPFPQQADRWDVDWKYRWASLVDAAAEVKTYNDHYNITFLNIRNEGIVNESDKLVALYDGKVGGGTAYALWYSVKCGKEVDNLWEQWRHD